jgi:hypothetical protein
VQQGADLQPVARRLAVIDDDAVCDGLFDGRNDQLHTQPVDPFVPRGKHFGEVESGVDLEHGERKLGRVEGFLGQPHHDDRVLAAGEHQHRTLELGGDFAEDVDRLRLQLLELAEAVVRVGLHRPSIPFDG